MENLPVPGPRKRTPGGGPWWYARGDLNPYPCGMEPKGYVTLVKDFQSPPYHKGRASFPTLQKIFGRDRPNTC